MLLPSSNTTTPDDPLFLQLEELEAKLDKIYEFETNGLITRSRIRWLEEGERSSKYFCNLENRAWQRKNITKLKDNQGILITNSNNILKNIHDFYAQLYSTPDVNSIPVDDSVLNNAVFDNITVPQLSEDDKQNFETPFSRNEIYEAVK